MSPSTDSCRVTVRVALARAQGPCARPAGRSAAPCAEWSAAGYSGEDVDPQCMSLWFGNVLVFSHGMPTSYSESEATAAIQPREVSVRLDLGQGDATATIWTCDLSHDYVTINGKYRT